jgi:hypothetical protein
MSIDVEYAIKKDIRNNPVVREVDHGQKREFLRTLWLAVVVVGTLLFAVWQHYEVVNYGYEIEKVRKDLSDGELAVARQYERVHAPQHLEKRATQEAAHGAGLVERHARAEKAPATTAGKGSWPWFGEKCARSRTPDD